MFFGRLVPRPEITLIVAVDPIRKGFESEFVEEFIHPGKKLALAVVTPIRGIAPIFDALHFMGRNEPMGNIEIANDLFRHDPVTCGIGGRYGGHRKKVFSQGLPRRPREVTRIYAPREGDKKSTPPAQVFNERVFLVLKFRGQTEHRFRIRVHRVGVKRARDPAESAPRLLKSARESAMLAPMGKTS
jgi:hypothetical protein